MENKFSIKELAVHFLKWSWLIVLLAVIGGGAMYLTTKQTTTTANYAGRLIYAGSDYSQSTKSTVANDDALFNTLTQPRLVMNPAILGHTVAIMKREGIKEVTTSDVYNTIKVKKLKSTLYLHVSATTTRGGDYVAKLVDAYTEALTQDMPEILPTMPKLRLMVHDYTAPQVRTSTSGNRKNAALFGGATGAAIAVIAVFGLGVYKNFKAAGKAA